MLGHAEYYVRAVDVDHTFEVLRIPDHTYVDLAVMATQTADLKLLSGRFNQKQLCLNAIV